MTIISGPMGLSAWKVCKSQALQKQLMPSPDSRVVRVEQTLPPRYGMLVIDPLLTSLAAAFTTAF